MMQCNVHYATSRLQVPKIISHCDENFYIYYLKIIDSYFNCKILSKNRFFVQNLDSSKSIYSPVNFIGPDSVTDTDLRLNCRIPVSNSKQNLHYARNSDLKLCAMWHLKINNN